MYTVLNLATLKPKMLSQKSRRTRGKDAGRRDLFCLLYFRKKRDFVWKHIRNLSSEQFIKYGTFLCQLYFMTFF